MTVSFPKVMYVFQYLTNFCLYSLKIAHMVFKSPIFLCVTMQNIWKHVFWLSSRVWFLPKLRANQALSSAWLAWHWKDAGVGRCRLW